MTNWARLAATFVLSLVASGAAQYALMLAKGEILGRRFDIHTFIEVFTPLAVVVALVTVIFAIVVRWGPYAAASRWCCCR